MTRNKNTGRKTGKTVRMPATKFSALQKRRNKDRVAAALRDTKRKSN